MRILHIAQYLWEIWWIIPCNWKQKRMIQFEMERSVRAYVSNHPGADYRAICCRFGTPEQIASTYLEELEISELVERIRIKNRIVCIVKATAICVLVLWSGAICIALFKHAGNTGGFLVEEVKVISEIEYSIGGIK